MTAVNSSSDLEFTRIFSKELTRIRGITPANLNTFSNADHTRHPAVMERLFWMMYDHFKRQDEAFIKARHKGKLSGYATAISNTSINSMEVWNHPDTTSMQVSTLILFHMLRMFMLQGAFAVVHFAAYLPQFAA